MAPRKRKRGRPPGALNKTTEAFLESINGLVVLSNNKIQQILDGTLPCSTCKGRGKTRFQPKRGKKPGIRTCESCWESGLEVLSPELIAKVALDTREYAYPKLQRMEHVGDPDKPIQTRVKVSYE